MQVLGYHARVGKCDGHWSVISRVSLCRNRRLQRGTEANMDIHSALQLDWPVVRRNQDGWSGMKKVREQVRSMIEEKSSTLAR